MREVHRNFKQELQNKLKLERLVKRDKSETELASTEIVPVPLSAIASSAIILKLLQKKSKVVTFQGKLLFIWGGENGRISHRDDVIAHRAV